eukprot:INCI8140.1.p1 GENE.INCI8140.1~~INCI8140.1.p1  ORF type:complete len:1674 (+),score=297.41 INCI8140.1:503-5524(+)
MSNSSNVTALFCGATFEGSVLEWNFTVQDIWWADDFFAPCASFVLLPAALFVCAVFLRVLGCLGRLGSANGFGAAAASSPTDPVDATAVEYCMVDNFRFWGGVMVLVSWPTLIAHGKLNGVSDDSVFGDEVIGAVLVSLSVLFMLADQSLDVKVRWRAHRAKFPAAEAGCVSPNSLRQIVFWLLAFLALGIPLLGYYEPGGPDGGESNAAFVPDFEFWSLAIRAALALFTLVSNAIVGRYLTTGTGILRLPPSPQTASRRNKRPVRATTTGNELQDPLLDNGENRAGANDDAHDDRPAHVRRSPEEDAWFVSKGWFSWLNPIMRVGARRPLVQEDLYPVHPSDCSETCQDRLAQEWEREVADRPAEPSYLRALYRAFGKPFVLAGVFKFIYDSLKFANPQLLGALVRYIGLPVEEAPAWQGWVLVGAMFACNFVASWILHQYFHGCYRTGMRLKSGTVTMIFQKALVINYFSTDSQKKNSSEADSDDDTDKKPNPETAKAKKKRLAAEKKKKKNTVGALDTTGAIVNLMSVDAQRLQDICAYIHMLWSGPYQIVLALVFLGIQLGWAMLAGIAVMLAMFPLSAAIATKIKSLQQSLMKIKDERIKVTNEVMAGMKIIKLYAWESSFGTKLDDIRAKELSFLTKYMACQLLTRFLWTVVPAATSVATFATYVAMGNVLRADTAFVALSLFQYLSFPLAMLPRMIAAAMEASISLARVAKFLGKPDVGKVNTEADPGNVVVRGVQLYWDSPAPTVDENGGNGGGAQDSTATTTLGESAGTDALGGKIPLLDGADFSVAAGELCVIIGRTGSGKSGLMSALIGDLPVDKGVVALNGSVAFAAQSPWIQNATVRDNILFGRPFEPEWYEQVVEACALVSDFAILPAGDMSEIGAKGINLSGGQKQRIAIARSLYQRSDICLLDDCLSAVDADVSQHIFSKCIQGLLKDKTVVLVTHNVSLAKHADVLVALEAAGEGEVGGRMVFAGSPNSPEGQKILQREALILQQQRQQADTAANREPQAASEAPNAVGGGQKGHVDEKTIALANGEAGDNAKKSAAIAKQEDDDQPSAATATKSGAKLVEKEDQAKGAVTLAVYISYIKVAGGMIVAFAALVGFVGINLFQVLGSNGLAVWSDQMALINESSPDAKDINFHYLASYSALQGGMALFTAFNLTVFIFGALRASRVMHHRMLWRLLRAPMAFFDATPIGRILNRFSKDMYTVDEQLQYSMYMYVSCMFSVVATIAIITYATPVFLLAIVPAMWFYSATQDFFIATSRELMRLTSVSRSPIFSHFSETLDGASSIRAFKAQKRFTAKNYEIVNTNNQAYYLSVAINRWLAMRLEFAGTCIVVLASFFAVYSRSSVAAGLAGLSISYAMNVTQTLNWMVRMTSDRETQIVSVERIKTYSEVPQERASKSDPDVFPASQLEAWPSKGGISIRNLRLRYRPGLPLVIKGLDVDFPPASKVGIAGRTGAGKSSLLLALMRLVEPEEGSSIRIDGKEILSEAMGLDDLRSRVAIIPQDPVLFTGSIRFNLDPWSTKSDAEIWDAVNRAHLRNLVNGLDDKLDSEVAENGRNFAAGQRQLLCLARALLRNSKVVLLDEATSSVDNETDQLIQATISEAFHDATVITIAHRIDTIMNGDLVMVMDNGRMSEIGSPSALLDDPESAFSNFYRQYRK